MNKENDIKFEKCFICGGGLEPFLVGKDILYEVNDKNFNLSECKKCKLKMINPPTERMELKSYYPHNYYSYSEQKKKSLLKELKMSLINVNYDKSEKGPLALIARIANKIFDVDMYFGIPLRKRGGNNFLDIGCGDGEFVKNMQDVGWNSYGYEMGEKQTKDRIFYDSDFTQENFDNIKFDCIRIWHVFEHVANPIEYLEKMFSLLTNDGIIYMGLPNTDSINARIFRKYWLGYDIPRHQINYNLSNLTNLLNKFNLTIVKRSNSGNMFFSSLSLLLKSKLKFNINFPFILSAIFYVFYKKDCMTLVAKKSGNIA